MGEEGVLVIELPLPPKVLSPNVKTHWGKKTRATKAYRSDCADIAFVEVRRAAWVPRRVVLDVEYRCSQKAAGYVAKDVQNAISAMKAGVDGLVDAGVAENDSKAHITWGAFDLVTRKSAKGDGVTVTVRRV